MGLIRVFIASIASRVNDPNNTFEGTSLSDWTGLTSSLFVTYRMTHLTVSPTVGVLPSLAQPASQMTQDPVANWL